MSYHRTTRYKSYKDRKTGEYVEAEPIFTEEEAGEYLRNNRKGMTIYFDEALTWKTIPAEQFKELFFSFCDYARDFERHVFPEDQWYLQSIYDAKCNSLDRDADRYLDTQALKVKGGRNSAKARAKQQEAKGMDDPEESVGSSGEVTLRDYCKENNVDVDDALQLYAEKNALWLPSRVLTGYITESVRKYEVLFDFSIARHHRYLYKNRDKGRAVILKGLEEFAENQSDQKQKPQEKADDKIILLGAFTLKRAHEQNRMEVSAILEKYAKNNGLDVADGRLYRQIGKHYDIFQNYTLGEITKYLQEQKEKYSLTYYFEDFRRLDDAFNNVCANIEHNYQQRGVYPDIPDITVLSPGMWDDEVPEEDSWFDELPDEDTEPI